MGNFWKVLGAAAFVVGSACSASAAVDVTKMTCADFSALGEVDELAASRDLLAWILDAANATATGNLAAKYQTNATNGQKWRPEEMHVEIEGHCIDAPADMTVVQRLQSHS